MEERGNIECPDQDIKETTTLSRTALPPQKSTTWRQAGKAEHPETEKQTKKSPKIGRQRKNTQLKGMKKSPEKELNEIEVNKLSDVQLKKNAYNHAPGIQS